MSHKKLFTSPQFWPIFWTQFWGAMNDNVFKNAMVMLITFKSYSILGLGIDQMVALCGGIFILPFFIFSSLSGQYADKISKSKMVVFTKYLEVFVMILGTFGHYLENLPLLFISLFLMGLQSTIFGPAKYSILPELLDEEDLVKGNALVEMGTFLAILIGTLLGGILIGRENGTVLISFAIIFISLLGLLCSLKLQSLAAVNPAEKIDFNLIRSTWDVFQISRQKKSIFVSILGISWFWFFGAALLSIFPVYVKNILHANESVVTLFLAVFSVGVAIGSVICEKCSHKRVELGLVPFGSLGLCWFSLHLYLIGTPYEVSGNPLTLIEFLSHPQVNWILFDLAGLSVMSGFFIVPLYTFIQVRSERETRSRVIAANNILNALFMVIAAVTLMALFAAGFTTIDIFLVLSVLNALISLSIYAALPEFLWRFVCVIMGRMIYPMKIQGDNHIPAHGPAILVCNHVSFVDGLIISANVKRPVHFVMHYSSLKIPFLSFLFRGAQVILLDDSKKDPDLMSKAFDKIAQTLKEGEIVCIFPEGEITRDGKLNHFRSDIERIIERNPVPVIPMVIKDFWGNFLPARMWSRPEINIDSALTPQTVTAQTLEIKVQDMLKDGPE